MRKLFLLVCLIASTAHGAPLTDCTAKAEPTYSRISRTVHNFFHPHHRIYPKPELCGAPDMITIEVDAPPWKSEDITPADTSLNVGYMATGGMYGNAIIVTPWVELPVTSPAVWHDAHDPIETYERPEPQPVPEPATWLVLLSGASALYVMRRRYVRT